MQTPSNTVYQFGPFEVNAASGELVKNGKHVKLQEQPFRLLVVLLENAGEVVSHEDLRTRIWPEDTFVDFDGSLRVAVRKLRDALGDEPERPRYIETIPRHGYRFLESAMRPAEALAPAANPQTEATEKARAPARQWILAAVVLPALLVITGTAIWLHQRHRHPVLTEKDSVVLADFVNTTGDPVFDGTLRQGMAVQLEQSPFLKLLSDNRVEQQLRLMGQQPDAQLTPPLAQQVCERTGSAAVLDGSIARVGSEYVLGLQARDCQTGDILFADQAQAARKEDVLNTLSQMARKFRTNAGESLAAIQKHNTPLIDATTPSLDALKAYSEGMKVVRVQGEVASIPFFKRAIEIDPQFAIAYAWLGLEYSSASEPGLAAEYESKAYQLRDRANDRERFPHHCLLRRSSHREHGKGPADLRDMGNDLSE